MRIDIYLPDSMKDEIDEAKTKLNLSRLFRAAFKRWKKHKYGQNPHDDVLEIKISQLLHENKVLRAKLSRLARICVKASKHKSIVTPPQAVDKKMKNNSKCSK